MNRWVGELKDAYVHACMHAGISRQATFTSSNSNMSCQFLHLQLLCFLSIQLVLFGNGLDTINLSTPLAAVFVIAIIEGRSDSSGDGSQGGLVFSADFSQSNHSSSLLANQGTKTSLTLDNTVRDIHVAAESRQPDHQLDGSHIVGNDNQRSLLVLNESSHVVETELQQIGLLLGILAAGKRAFDLLVGSSNQTFLLLNGGFGTVLVEKLEQFSGYNNNSLVKKN